MAITSVNPASGEIIGEYEEHTPRAVAEAVAKAHEAFRSWRRTGFEERARLMQAAARVLEEDVEELEEQLEVSQASLTSSLPDLVSSGRKACLRIAPRTLHSSLSGPASSSRAYVARLLSPGLQW